MYKKNKKSIVEDEKEDSEDKLGESIFNKNKEAFDMLPINSLVNDSKSGKNDKSPTTKFRIKDNTTTSQKVLK